MKFALIAPGLLFTLCLGLFFQSSGGNEKPSASTNTPNYDISHEASEQSCLDCHTKSQPHMVAAWQKSKHAEKGVGCVSCHGSNHSKIFETKGVVSAAVCGSCHANELKEFSQSLHAQAMTLMAEDDRFHHLSPALSSQTCQQCHGIGVKFPDNSVGRCNSCHSSHSFSVQEARRPEACIVCHSGLDHAQGEMWSTSKHGQLYASKDTQSQSATCVTCHMPGGSHNTGMGLAFGHVANGGTLSTNHFGLDMRLFTEEKAEKERSSMLQTCLPCHSSRFASESLTAADTLKLEADQMLFEAGTLILELRKDGLLETSKEMKLLNSNAATEIEQRFFSMAKFSHTSAFKGAYHQSPMHTYTKGVHQLQQDLAFIKREAQQLRKKIQ